MIRFTCGVPGVECGGSLMSVGKAGCKTHAQPQEAFACYCRWLLKQGYERIGKREFVRADDAILVLRKSSHFGRPLRLGKTGEGAAKSNRMVPRGNPGHKAIVII